LVDRFFVLKNTVASLQERLNRCPSENNDLFTYDLLEQMGRQLSYFAYLEPKDVVRGQHNKLKLENQVLRHELDQALKKLNIPSLTARIISEQREEIERLQSLVYKLEQKNDRVNDRTAV
jgi:hypothetical protein